MCTVLVVEDQLSIRMLLRNVLETSGHNVIEAADGHQAIEACSVCAVDVLICDLHLPDMMAPDIIPIVLTSNPSLKVLVMSGESEDTVRSFGISDQYWVMNKPFKSLRSFASLKEHDLTVCPTQLDIEPGFTADEKLTSR